MTKKENKFPEKYTVIEKIKLWLKKNPDVTESQVKKYNSRALAPSGAFLMTHIDLIQLYYDKSIKQARLYNNEKKERLRLEQVCSGHSQKYERAKNNIIEEFGTKSFEYSIFMKGNS
tara:strand:+ start:2286 stop:2636 length:351 start_codon:yes stop_codon:yes gene_type:complete